VSFLGILFLFLLWGGASCSSFFLLHTPLDSRTSLPIIHYPPLSHRIVCVCRTTRSAPALGSHFFSRFPFMRQRHRHRH
jgi:hypothetical protein